MSRMRTATTLAALPLAGLLFTAPTAFGHGEDTREQQSVHRDLEAEHSAVHRDLNAGHRAGHRELEAAHEAAHQWPMTKKQHRRLHKDLKKEHRAQHRDLEGVHGDVHQDLNAEHRDAHAREWDRDRYAMAAGMTAVIAMRRTLIAGPITATMVTVQMGRVSQR